MSPYWEIVVVFSIACNDVDTYDVMFNAMLTNYGYGFIVMVVERLSPFMLPNVMSTDS